jgi:hypothetical protein
MDCINASCAETIDDEFEPYNIGSVATTAGASGLMLGGSAPQGVHTATKIHD